MSKRYRLVVFDWEGTLGDTLGQILNNVAVEARRLNFGELDEQLARQSVELGLVKAMKIVFPHLTLQQHQQLLQAVQQSLVSRHADVYLIPGAKLIVERLAAAGLDVAIATNKGQQSLHRALQLSGLDALIKVTRSAGQTPPKPCPQMLEEILDEFSLTPKDAIMVGDSVTDIEMAKSIGMDAVGVDFYHQQREALEGAGALCVFDDFQLFAEFIHLPEFPRKSEL
ncbi:HAD-IIIA family hydrolase [Legionella taurinensis]|uniref:HAD family hydrolase n=1 Tax=Legionella taurinensis TaxID=70611 RepID=A0A3A5LLD1_9GAMM|nr:HAD-IIIA family hydrolase [Legionella taurinensis]MDX1836450.1 HAD-IIIA family hydrolase [Legionella taurinensis]PUT43079.1 HAD family hydrolase [Legionella taurinensis]PUT45104.1 HAD family hydrolase [Legionella taurinensis]PUT45634.1 HAD family hydrolase [Legionella taurinensis]PUT49403.1 HAD family hydrolase [Legionella taurinensis]